MEQLLEHTILNGNEAEILQLLQQQNINVNTVNEVGDTVLHLTLQNSKLLQNEIVEILDIFITRNVDVHIKNKKEETALHLAITRWNREIIDFLLKHNAKIDVTDSEGNTILHFFIVNMHKNFSKHAKLSNDNKIAIERESVEFVEWLLLKGFDFDVKNKNGQSALYLAIEYNLQHILPCLLRQTRDINFVSESGQTLLHLLFNLSNKRFSISFGTSQNNQYNIHLTTYIQSSDFSQRYDIAVVKILLERGVSIDHLDNNSNTALHLAIGTDMEMTIVHGRIEAQLIVTRANTKANMDIVQMLLNRFTGFNDERGFSLIRTLVQNANNEYDLNVLATLIAKGVNVNNKDKNGLTPLYYAFRHKNSRAIGLMRKAGADFGLLMDEGSNLFHALAEIEPKDDDEVRYQEEIFDMLMIEGRDINAKNNDGETPLHVAVNNDNNTLVRKLIAHGADIHCRDVHELTLLDLIVWKQIDCDSNDRKRIEEVMELLLDNGANINRKSLRYDRLIHMVASLGTTDMLKILLRHGAEANVRDLSGNSALVRALLGGFHADVEQLLTYGADINDDCVIRVLQLMKSSNRARAALCQHLIKLKAANLSCSKEYKSFLTQEVHHILYQDCLREVDKLKSYYIDSLTSLYQWLHMDPNRRYLHSHNEKLQTLVESPTLVDEFPEYSTVILGHYHETEARRRLLEPAKKVWLELTGIDLLDCLEHIFAFLNTGDIFHFIEEAEEEANDGVEYKV